MSIKKIYLVRHGETDFNKIGVVQGSGVDSDLNETGRLQAQLFFDAYSDLKPSKVYTSQLRRSIQSVEPFLNQGHPHKPLAGLNEIDWGEREGKAFSEFDDNYYEEVLGRWQAGEVTYAIEGGESPEDVSARQAEALKEIMSKDDEKTVLICMHGRAMRILLCQLLGYPLARMDVFDHQNLGLYVLHYTGSMFRITTFNDTKHLEKWN